ncbi:Sodium/hydrogen exchanger 9B1 [Toxocara canis]|uniref:Sodium/hydrogen exchanger 9B1 n=1 Tax=Toxocara canis TaxID=6265 RepID=A0A0B2W5W5_TOXCA|nr:Sodium/hydrogen exchanger 9B1 [Toxocara canis]
MTRNDRTQTSSRKDSNSSSLLITSTSSSAKNDKNSFTADHAKSLQRSKHLTYVTILKMAIDEIKTLLAYLLFSICLYLTALAIFRRRLLSRPFEVQRTDSNWSVAENISHKEQYIASTFSLIIMLTSSTAIGYFISLIQLPTLFGMLITGIFLRNMGFVELFLLKEWGMALRKTAFVVILLRGGLGLDSNALKRLKGVCFRLSFIPCSVEAITIAITSYAIFRFSWLFAFALGFVLAAVSPAVVIPAMLRIAKRGYGVASGVPTVVIAAAAIDDVYAIAGFGAFISAAFSKGGIAWTVVRAPLEAVIGVMIGGIVGVILWYIPNDHGRVHFTRVVLLIQIGTTSMFGTEALGFTSVGPIAVVVSALVAALRWKKQHVNEKQGATLIEEDALATLWDFVLQPMLFTSIGFELDIAKVSSKTYRCIAVICVGLMSRIFAAFCATFGAKFKWKERMFIALAWIPKATVQAALSPIVLDMATMEPIKDENHLKAGLIILTVGVLSILISASLGALFINFFAPLLLSKDGGTVMSTHEISQNTSKANAVDSASRIASDGRESN